MGSNSVTRNYLNKISKLWWRMTDDSYKKMTTGVGNICSLCLCDNRRQCKPQHIVARVLGNVAMFGDDSDYEQELFVSPLGEWIFPTKSKSNVDIGQALDCLYQAKHSFKYKDHKYIEDRILEAIRVLKQSGKVVPSGNEDVSGSSTPQSKSEFCKFCKGVGRVFYRYNEDERRWVKSKENEDSDAFLECDACKGSGKYVGSKVVFDINGICLRCGRLTNVNKDSLCRRCEPITSVLKPEHFKGGEDLDNADK